MGLKTTNYEVKSMGVTLPEAYAIIRETKTSGDSGFAMIAVHTTRELAANKSIKPFEEVRIDFTVDRNANDRETAYTVAKGQKTFKKFNAETKQMEDAIVNMPFYGWEDDIVSEG